MTVQGGTCMAGPVCGLHAVPYEAARGMHMGSSPSCQHVPSNTRQQHAAARPLGCLLVKPAAQDLRTGRHATITHKHGGMVHALVHAACITRALGTGKKATGSGS